MQTTINQRLIKHIIILTRKVGVDNWNCRLWKRILFWILLLNAIPLFSLAEQVPIYFSAQGGFYPNTFSLTLSCPKTYTIHYTTNGNVPTAFDAVYESPLLLGKQLFSNSNIYTIQTCPDKTWFVPDTIQKSIVIRAAAFDSEGNMCSDVVTNSYFIKSLASYPTNLPVISICADSSALFSFEEGILLQGGAHANCFQHGKDWERLCNVEFYEQNNSGINQQAGLRMHGGFSRAGIQKGMKLYARNKYGKNNFCHKFFETTENNCFKHLVLKPFRDGIPLGDLLGNRLAYFVDVETMASRLVVIFLNGEYWGIYILKEKPDAQYIEEHFGYNKKDVNVIKSWQGDVADGTNDNFVAMMRWFQSANLSDKKTYDQACQLIDMNCFIDYYCFCLWTGISDWPSNNMRCWQVGDGKWRWIFFDCDSGCQPFYPNTLKNAIYSENNDTASVLLFTKLLENPDFREKFYYRYGNLLVNELYYDNTIKTFESCIASLDNETDKHFARFMPNAKVKFESGLSSISQKRNLLKHRIADAAGMVYIFYCNNGWQFKSSANPKYSHFKHKLNSRRPSYLFKMWKQFDNFRFVKAYFSYEPIRIREQMKATKLFQYCKKKLKPKK